MGVQISRLISLTLTHRSLFFSKKLNRSNEFEFENQTLLKQSKHGLRQERDGRRLRGQKKEGESNESGGGLMDKINTMAGGGKASEKDEDALDKGIDAFQQYGMGEGPQNNESAVEQAKDEAISDYIRGQYQDATGSKVPIEDK